MSKAKDLVELSFSETSSLDAITRQLPQGLYTTFRTYGGGTRVLGLSGHLKRLYQPSEQPGLTIPELCGKLRLLFKKYPNEARLRVIVSKNGDFFVIIQPLHKLPDEIYERGVSVITSTIRRRSPHIKSTTFISASSIEREQISGSKYHEALLVRNGRILEGMTSNFFYVQENKLGTAKRGVLPGITRRTILQLAKERGMDTSYHSLKREQLPAITEAFITSSSRGIVPVIQIDDQQVGEGLPGPVTKLLLSEYRQYVERWAEII